MACRYSERIELVVHRAHIDVVDVEQDQTVGRARRLAQEFPLREPRIAERDVARDVLQQDAPPEQLLHRAHPLHHVASASSVYGSGSRSCVLRPATPVQHR